MRMPPIEKQFEIMDLIYQKLSIRAIAKKTKVSKGTVQNYKKRGPPIYRKNPQNPLTTPYPTTIQNELNVARQQYTNTVALNDKLIQEINTANKNSSDLQENNDSKNTKINCLKSENKILRIELDKVYDNSCEVISYVKNVVEQINTLKSEKRQRDDHIKNIQEQLHQYEKELAVAYEREKFSKSKIHELTTERDMFKDKTESLKRKHEHDWMLFLTVAILSFIGGIITDRAILPKIKEFILSWGAKYGINTEDIANQFSQINMIQPDTQHNYSGAIPIIIVSSTFWSGVFFNPSGKTYSARCEPVQKFDSGVCAPTHGYTSPGYPVVPNPQDDMIQADGQGSGDVTISTFTSDTIQTSGTVMINHVETRNIPQVASSHYIPPLQISQMYFLPQTTPVPTELIGPFGWIPIRQMNWMQSTPFICWLFEQLGYKLLSMKKSHDKGADMLLERLGERLVIQVKHQQVNTGIDALKDVEFGKTMTNATRKIVISFGSPFTRDAPKDAEKAGIELWDLDCVIDEMHKYNIYYPID